MKIKTPISGAKLRNHFTYHIWLYILVAVAAFFGSSLLYTVTAYRSPEDKRIDLYIQSATVSAESAEKFLQPIWEQYVPDMEVVDAVMLTISSQDYYGAMQLTTYVMAQEGDLYLLGTSDYKSFASQGLFIDLQPYIDAGKLHLDGIDLSAGYVAAVDENGLPVGERQLYGIPLYALYGYMDMGLDNRDTVLGVTVYNGNEENVIAFLDGFIQAGRADKPDWLN